MKFISIDYNAKLKDKNMNCIKQIKKIYGKV